jgi:hypothetical protein
MFETVRAIHEALRTESTLAFVLFMAMVFAVLNGGVAWLVDRGYKNSLVEAQSETRPWLFVSPNIDQSSGSISLVVSNQGKTPAYNVNITELV